jgi:hypothetical protein
MAVSLVATAVMTSVLSMRVTCWTSKPDGHKKPSNCTARVSPTRRTAGNNVLLLLPFVPLSWQESKSRSSSRDYYPRNRGFCPWQGNFFSTQWSVFHQTASEIAVAMAHMETPSNTSLPFVDPSAPDLEELCVTAARQALKLKSLVIQYRQQEGEI